MKVSLKLLKVSKLSFEHHPKKINDRNNTDNYIAAVFFSQVFVMNKDTCKLLIIIDVGCLLLWQKFKSFLILFKMILSLSEKNPNKIRGSGAWAFIQFLFQQFIEC